MVGISFLRTQRYGILDVECIAMVWQVRNLMSLTRDSECSVVGLEGAESSLRRAADRTTSSYTVGISKYNAMCIPQYRDQLNADHRTRQRIKRRKICKPTDANQMTL